MAFLLITIFYTILTLGAIATIQSLAVRLLSEAYQVWEQYQQKQYLDTVDWFLFCGCNLTEARYRAVIATS